MSYNVKLEAFEGPFDLLVFLIEKAQMDIYDIAISEITEQYIEYIEMMQNFSLELVSEFLVLAATLIEIKSKMLLLKKEDTKLDETTEIDPRTELVEKIIEYKKYKNAAEMLREKHEQNSKVIFKVKEDLFFDDNKEYIDIDMDQFIRAFNLFLKKKKKISEIRKRYTEIKIEKISVKEKKEQIKKFFTFNKKMDFTQLISDNEDKHEIIVTFMAMLELIKDEYIKVKQHIIFGNILLFANNRGEKQDE